MLDELGVYTKALSLSCRWRIGCRLLHTFTLLFTPWVRKLKMQCAPRECGSTPSQLGATKFNESEKKEKKMHVVALSLECGEAFGATKIVEWLKIKKLG
jgi:hypothetical protein